MLWPEGERQEDANSGNPDRRVVRKPPTGHPRVAHGRGESCVWEAVILVLSVRIEDKRSWVEDFAVEVVRTCPNDPLRVWHRGRVALDRLPYGGDDGAGEGQTLSPAEWHAPEQPWPIHHVRRRSGRDDRQIASVTQPLKSDTTNDAGRTLDTAA